MSKIVLNDTTINVSLWEDPRGADAWLAYEMPSAWMAESAFDNIPEDAPRYEVQRYLSLCVHLECVPDWETFQACNVHHVPNGDADYILGELLGGDWIDVLFPGCPDAVRPYLDAEAVYRDYYHLDSDLEFEDAADPETVYVMASRPDM